jgi:hypothetical protein
VLLITDPTFAAGIISQKNRVPGTLKGLGRSQVQVDWVQNEIKVEEGEWFSTSGDRPRLPQGSARRAGQGGEVRLDLPKKSIWTQAACCAGSKRCSSCSKACTPRSRRAKCPPKAPSSL